MIIGLAGYAQSGKDEVARTLVEEYGFTRVAFADKIRELAYELNPIVEGYEDTDSSIKPIYLQEWVDEKGWDRAKVKEPEIRRILQRLGIAGRKVFGDNHWIVEAYKGMDLDTNYVIPDVRFKNEMEWVQAFNGNVWRIIRPGVGPVNGHISETELDSYEVDTKILNIGTLNDLRSIVRNLMESQLGNQMH